MNAFDIRLNRRIIELQMRLYACCARMQARTDDEALHELRIAVRRLRSLLRPLRQEPLCAALEQSAGALGKASGPLRDLEVLAAELRRLGQSEAAQRRLAERDDGYAQLLAGVPLQRLQIRLDDWPQDCRDAHRDGQWQAGAKQVRRNLARQVRKLTAALRDPSHDRHRLRLLIKRLRYCAEAWPAYSELSASTLRALRQAQGALGDWHDHLQWLLRVQSEADLLPCVQHWQVELLAAERQADECLAELALKLSAS
ncbi:CHAD domain-containing protein [Pseudomonas sp. GOM6]|uniref:CHAD domain-containing protein n=1 Tax=Pseudomonas sp. GOM6 TaxID=3036944 RepID=UPI00240A3659|nr:CHAD domain-containing protein [Pseudomonas sp. GOM6]MDG1582016.1 CHAD domain-containing protein [Pseudomonas sp. GOM6]